MTASLQNIQAFIQSWQAQGVLSSSKVSMLEDTIKEPPNALALAINLQTLPLKDKAEWVEHASEDEIKDDKGLRTTFFIAKMLYPGFTFVPPPANADKGVRGDRLAVFDSDEEKRTVIFYTYKGENNKKLDTYVKTKRFEDCTSVSQGMVLTSSIWANKLQSMIKKKIQFENIGIFELCLVHLGIKSIMSKASENGMMLEIKNIMPLHQCNNHTKSYTLGLSNLVSHELPTRSLQESAEFRNRFLEGLLVSEARRKNLKQEFVKGNFSTTMHLLALSPEARHGAIAVSADGKLKFFQQQPIGDLMATTIELSYDSNMHLGPLNLSGNEDQTDVNMEWMAKLFNVALMLGALEFFVIVDEYKLRNNKNNNKDSSSTSPPSQAADIHLQGFARINERSLLAKLIAISNTNGTNLLLDTVASDEEEIFRYISGEGVDTKHLVIFQQCGKDLDLVVDMRRMINKRISSSPTMPPLSSLIHTGGAWSKGHMLHVFFEKKCVLSLVISLSDVQNTADGGVYKRALEPTQMIKSMDFMDYDEEEPTTSTSTTTTAPVASTTATISNSTTGGTNSTSSGKPPKSKKIKTTSTAEQQQDLSSSHPSTPPS